MQIFRSWWAAWCTFVTALRTLHIVVCWKPISGRRSVISLPEMPVLYWASLLSLLLVLGESSALFSANDIKLWCLHVVFFTRGECNVMNATMLYSPQLRLWLHGFACADEHQASDRAEAMQRCLDAQRRAACKFCSPFLFFLFQSSANGNPASALDWNWPRQEVLVPLGVCLPHPQTANLREQPANEAHLWSRHLQRCSQQTDQRWEVSQHSFHVICNQL